MVLHCPEKSPEAQSKESEHEEYRTAVECHAESVYEEQVEVCGYLRKIRYDSEKDDCQDHYGNSEYLDVFLECVVSVFALLVIEHEDEGRDCKKVQKVDSDGQAHDERDEHDPSVRIWGICLLVPFGHGPEYKCGHQG